MPAPVRAVLEQLPPATHPMDVMRTRRVGAGLRAARSQRPRCRGRARDRRSPGGQLRLDALLLVSLLAQRPPHPRRDRRRLRGRAFPAPAAPARRRRANWVRAMHTSLNLYAEHEFNSSTFTARVIAGTGLGHLFLHHRRHRRAARTQTRRRQRSGARNPGTLRHARRGRGGHPPARGQQGDRHRLRPSGLHRRPIRAT